MPYWNFEYTKVLTLHCGKSGRWYRPSLLHPSSLVPRPHLRERVWWHPADTSGFINVDYFLERNFSPPITLQKRQSVV